MEMIDMKLPKKSMKEMKGMPIDTSKQDRWPYGLQLRFEKEQIEKIPSLTNYKIGDKVLVTAEACVTSIRMSEQQGGEENHSVELQIEKIACEPSKKKEAKNMSMKEYRTAREKKEI